VPSPVRRKEIRKENGGGMRKLGIPTVLDLRHGPATGGSSSRCWVAGHDTDLGAALQHAQLWIPAGAEGGRCSAGRAKVRRRGPGLGRGFGYHQIFRSRQLGHPDGEDRTSDPRQTGVAAHRAISAGGRHGGRSGGQERGGNAARRAAVSTAGEHLSGRLRSRTGTARTSVQPVRGRLQHLRRQSGGGGTSDGVDPGLDRKATAVTGVPRHSTRSSNADREAMRKVCGVRRNCPPSSEGYLPANSRTRSPTNALASPKSIRVLFR